MSCRELVYFARLVFLPVNLSWKFPSSLADAYHSLLVVCGSPHGSLFLRQQVLPKSLKITRALENVRIFYTLPFMRTHLGRKVMIVSACLFILGYAMTWAPYVS
jgi:hypothetical protein